MSLRAGAKVKGPYRARAWLDVVTIAPRTIRPRHLVAADRDLFHDAKSSNMLLPHRFSTDFGQWDLDRSW